MKKIVLALSATTLLLVSFTNSNAQASDYAALTGKKGFAGNSETTTAGSFAATAKSNKMAARALKDFTRSFKNVENADWLVTNSGSFVASFKDADKIGNWVYYNEKGNYICSIKRYGEETLPAAVRHQVKSNYYDYKIIAVEEIEASGATFYLVHVQDDNTSKTLRIDDDGMNVVEDLHKQ